MTHQEALKSAKSLSYGSPFKDPYNWIGLAIFVLPTITMGVVVWVTVPILPLWLAFCASTLIWSSVYFKILCTETSGWIIQPENKVKATQNIFTGGVNKDGSRRVSLRIIFPGVRYIIPIVEKIFNDGQEISLESSDITLEVKVKGYDQDKIPFNLTYRAFAKAIASPVYLTNVFTTEKDAAKKVYEHLVAQKIQFILANGSFDVVKDQNKILDEISKLFNNGEASKEEESFGYVVDDQTHTLLVEKDKDVENADTAENIARKNAAGIAELVARGMDPNIAGALLASLQGVEVPQGGNYTKIVVEGGHPGMTINAGTQPKQPGKQHNKQNPKVGKK